MFLMTIFATKLHKGRGSEKNEDEIIDMNAIPGTELPNDLEVSSILVVGS